VEGPVIAGVHEGGGVGGEDAARQVGGRRQRWRLGGRGRRKRSDRGQCERGRGPQRGVRTGAARARCWGAIGRQGPMCLAGGGAPAGRSELRPARLRACPRRCARVPESGAPDSTGENTPIAFPDPYYNAPNRNTFALAYDDAGRRQPSRSPSTQFRNMLCAFRGVMSCCARLMWPDSIGPPSAFGSRGVTAAAEGERDTWRACIRCGRRIIILRRCGSPSGGRWAREG
jgi:hypothetical protein